MLKVEPAVKKETIYISLWVAICSALMHAVFLVIQKWTLSVLWGNLLGGGIAILNFFLMGLSVQAAVSKDEKGAKRTMRISIFSRWGLLAATAIVGVLVPFFNTPAALIPLFFPRLAIAFRPLFRKKDDN